MGLMPIYKNLLILIHFQKASLIGLELNANLLDASWWLEGASVKSENEDGYLRWVSGIERQLTPNLSMYLEYYHNGVGSLETQNYSRLAETFAYKYGRVFLLGREYLNWGSQWLITPLHSVSFTWKVNLLDGSDFVASQWEWNFKENLYLNLGGYLGFGKKSDDRSILNSEFGDQGVILYSMLRYYF